MLEFDGATAAKKVAVKNGGFERYPFELQDLANLESTDNKYLVGKIFLTKLSFSFTVFCASILICNSLPYRSS